MDVDAHKIVTRAPIIPVLEIDQLEHAVPIARALVDGGLPVLEITLRTDSASDAVRLIRREVPEAVVGVGTVRQPADLERAELLGAAFAVSPGFADSLAEAATGLSIPFLPGVMTPGEVIRARSWGLRSLKLFPAAQAGGVGMLKALHGPFPDIMFCPTGGITADTFHEYLAQPNVGCVGGSWLVPEGLVDRHDWEGVRAGAAAVCGTAFEDRGERS